ncbi:MAG TPA: alpha-amylase family glycosyl hydrolase [Kofleriaceae bacterium]|nr:alpha-amylase family glycosyl hydrolase [Kofleriaceae bacterium]
MKWVLLVLVACAAPARAPSGMQPDSRTAPPDTAGQGPDAAVARPDSFRDQVLYLVIPDRFRDGDMSNDTTCFDRARPKMRHGGDLDGLRAHLDYVYGLGATAVWITPPNRQIAPFTDACGYHGYWIDYSDPTDDDPIDPSLGGSGALDALVTELHARGMKLVLDMVVNHTGDTARLPHQHPSWFHDPQTCATLGPSQIFCPLDHHPDFAQEQPDVAAYLSTFEASVTARYQIDGIRMDTAKHVLPAYFHDSFFPAVRAAHPGIFAVGEIFDESSLAAAVPYLDAGFTSVFHFPLRRALVDAVAHGGSIDLVASAVADGIARAGADRALDLVLFIDNHDVKRFANEPGLGVSEDEIRRRVMLALDLIFTLPGIPQLYYGDELGMYGNGDPDNRHDLPAWAEDATARAQPHAGEAVAGSELIYARVQRLAQLRTTTPALIDGAYRELWRQNGATHPNVFAFSRGTGAGARIVVVNNGAARSGTIHIPVHDVADGTTLVDDLGDGAPATTIVAGGALVIDLPAKSAAIYRAGA